MYGIALDLGTSGFRAQLIDLKTNNVVKTALTMGHPLPGGNVTDHLDFAIKAGESVAHRIIIDTIKKIITKFNIEPYKIKKIAVCGNPIQLSLFQNIEFRDLAYAGENMQKRLGIGDVNRDARVFPAKEIFDGIVDMPDCNIIVPPAIRHEIGADALAMMIETDFLDHEAPSLITDYGTNAEMAIKVGNRIITGSAAAGPAIEGQGISCGMLASPGAISDVNPEGDFWRVTVLNENMEESKGDLIDPVTGMIIEKSDVEAVGLTGTGLISALSLAIKTGLMKNIPELPNGKLILGDRVKLTEKDIREAGKAIGAIRAVQLTLLVESGIKYQDLENVYMSGASGTYVDADKAREIGSCPNFAKRIVQFGNTSISLARELVIDDSKLDKVIELANTIKADHLMMATSDTFKDFYSCELAYWEEGMPIEQYNEFLEIYGYPKIPETNENPIKEKRVKKDIEDVGMDGVTIINDIGIKIEEDAVGCVECYKCEEECPDNSIMVVKKEGSYFTNYTSHKCLGTSCRRCVRACPVNAIQYKDIKVMSY